MRILFVQDHLRTGGAAKCALRIRQMCGELGHETLTLHGDKDVAPGVSSRTLHGKFRGLGRLREIVLAPERIQKQRKATAEKRLRQFLDNHPFDLIWFHNTAGAAKWGWTQAWIVAALQRSRVAITLHDMEYLGVGGPYVWDRPLSPSRFAGLDPAQASDWIRKGKLHLSACSDWLAKLCHDLYGLPVQRLTVPLWPEDFRGGPRSRRNLPAIHFLMAAERLDDPRKNILPTLDLLSRHRILETTNSRVFCLGRNFPDRFQDPRVISLGHLENRERFRSVYDQVDFLLHPSLLDNFPLLIQESLAQGCPVVALNRGGVGEAISEGRNGRLLANLSPKTLEETFSDLSSQNERDYEKISRQALEAAKEKFLFKNLVSTYQSYLASVKGNKLNLS